MARPFFDPPPAGKTRAELLAQAFPSRTNPAGRNPVEIFGPEDVNNFNMVMLKNGWHSTAVNENRWLHSNIREVSYTYTYKVFDKLNEIIESNE